MITPMDGKYLGALEAGGTRFNCAVAGPDGKIAHRREVLTSNPETTLAEVIEFFQEHGISALGVGCFGPLDLDPTSEDFGVITTTPKLDWRGVRMYQLLRAALDVPIRLQTDVGAAALGEGDAGHGQGLQNFVYVTVGTGIGCAIVNHGQLLHGQAHPEIGHYLPRPAPGDEGFAGICPSHGACLEGLASGPAIAARTGEWGELLPTDHPVWGIEADYLAQLAMLLTLVATPARIIFGGGVMEQPGLLPAIRQAFTPMLNQYIAYDALSDVESYITGPGAPDNPALIGALAMAGEALSALKERG